MSTRNATTQTHWCGYNDGRIRIAVIFPYRTGWAIAGRVTNPWAASHQQTLVTFPTLDEAKEDVQWRNPTIALTWKAEEVAQAGHEFQPIEKAS